MAKSYAKDFIDLNDYTLLDLQSSYFQPSENSKSSITFYSRTFVKKVNGMDSSAYVSVPLTSKGHLASINIGDVDAFSDKTLAAMKPYSRSNVETVVNRKMEATAGSLDRYDFSIERICCAVSPDGEAVVWVRGVCTYSTGNSKNGTFKSGIALIVKEAKSE